jgi:uncharacterized protein (TIRG00374 family)
MWQARPMTEPVAPPSGQIDKKKSIILGAIGLIVIILIFWKVIPQVGDYSTAFEYLKAMAPAAIAAVGVCVLIYLAVYGLPFMAATAKPGLKYWRSQQVNQAAFAISNGVPAGGAFGLAVQFAMLTSYSIPATIATSAITAVALWSMFVSLGLPILGVVALSVTGGDTDYSWVAPLGLAILVVGIGLFILVMRSAPLALKVGNLGNKLIGPLRSRNARLKDLDLVGPITKFRSDMYGLLKSRWAHLTAAQLGVIMTQFLIFYVALRGVQGWDEPGVSVLAVFGAFATSQIMLMVPITPGGLGTVDALMISLLVSVGVDNDQALAADLIWRMASYVPQIVVGIIALLTWFRQANKRFAAASPKTTPEPTAG